MNRLPPKHAVVVSGTSSEGRGVFFKLKRSSQTSLEGVHELSVAFAVPANWRAGEVQVSCSARGRRKLLWLKQSATLGEEKSVVRLQMGGTAPFYHVAKPVAVEPAEPPGSTAKDSTEARGMNELTDGGMKDRESGETVVEDGAITGR
jgi:hypothetical protein